MLLSDVALHLVAGSSPCVHSYRKVSDRICVKFFLSDKSLAIKKSLWNNPVRFTHRIRTLLVS